MSKKKYYDAIKTIDAFIYPFVDEALALRDAKMTTEDVADNEESDDRIPPPRSFLQALVATGEKDRKMCRDQCLNILLAGRDSTAGTLSFLFLELARHPEVVRKLRKEINQKYGKERRTPTTEELKEMEYLRWTLNETLRLYPPIPFNVRNSFHDTTLPRGGGPAGDQPIGVPKDSVVVYSTMYVHRRKDLYPPEGPHPAEFCPERWESWSPRAWEYIPFNGGPRVCIGQQFALTEIGYTAVRILQHFEKLDTISPDVEPMYKSEVVLSPVDGVKIRFGVAGSD